MQFLGAAQIHRWARDAVIGRADNADKLDLAGQMHPADSAINGLDGIEPIRPSPRAANEGLKKAGRPGAACFF